MRSILFALSVFGVLISGLVAAMTVRPAHAATALPPTAIIVDEGAVEFVRGGPNDYWHTATAEGSTYHNGQVFWTYNNAGNVENHAYWHLPSAADLASTYEVFVFVPGNNATTHSAQYQVAHNGPTVTRLVDQSIYFAEWVSLGVYTFTAASQNYVMLSDATGEAVGTQQVGFDAVAFVPVGAVQAPTATSTQSATPTASLTPSPTPSPTDTAPITGTTPTPVVPVTSPAPTDAPSITLTPSPISPISGSHIIYMPALLNHHLSEEPIPPVASPTPTAMPSVTPSPTAHPGNAFVSSLSRYVATINPAAHTRMGCESGRAGQAGTIILDFGQPQQVGFGYGTLIFDYATLASTQEIAEAAKAFARAFTECATKPASQQSLNLAIGTSNYRGATGFAHGKAWAQMVNELETWRKAQPANLAGRVTFVGANDIEPSWNTAAQTRDWVQGYASAALQPYFNYGSCDGCPSASYPNWQPNNNWTLEDVWFVSGGALVAKPFPEIYATGGIHAAQWQWVNLYAANLKGAAMDFAGVLTQWQACQDTNPVLCRDSGLDNTPQQGWQQMQTALNSDPRTAQTLPSPSDISWQTPTELPSAASDASARNTIARQTAGAGVIVDAVQAPLPALEFIASNVWIAGAPSAQGDVTYVFAGVARNPQLGGGLDAPQGAVAIVVREANGQFNRKRTLIVRAPQAASALHMLTERDGVLELRTDDGLILHFDLEQQAWVD